MKKIYIILFFITISLNLFSQQDSIIVNDSTYLYTWDTTTNYWAVTGLIIFSYDTNGNKTEETTYDINLRTNERVGNSRYTYLYDTNGNLSEEIWYRWDSEINDWNYTVWYCGGDGRECKGGRRNYYYNQQGKLTEIIHYDWNSGINNWVRHRSETYTNINDTSSNSTEYTIYSWDSEANDWIGDLRETKTYDANGNLIEFYYQ